MKNNKKSNSGRKRAGGKTPPAKPGLAQQFIDFVKFVEHIPYGASLMQEKRAAKGAIGLGVLVMSLGASVFALGWHFKWTWVVETAFVITVVGWMMVILGFAFGVVGMAAHVIPRDKVRKKFDLRR